VCQRLVGAASAARGGEAPYNPGMGLFLQLASHRPADAAEAEDLARIRDFVARHSDPFDRRIHEGHLTGSALVLSRSGAHVLLLHHRKLHRWLQPGGHGNAGEAAGEAVALREAEEETGLAGLCLHPTAPRPLDVDVHDIPARGGEPAHEHLDLRYLVLAPEAAELRRCDVETNDLRWFAWPELDALDLDPGLRRALIKAREIVATGAPAPPGPSASPPPASPRPGGRG
jgi:8-oxo-dGTP pyrophosphatase MutT (NUDIX family)